MPQPHFVHYIPIATTIFALGFAYALFKRYHERRSGPHLLWWGAGVLLYGAGTFAESWVTLFGWNEAIFRSWYITGALLGGAPLAQGTVYLIFPRHTATRMAWALMLAVAVAATFVLLTPINTTLVESYRLSGKVMAWQWVRLFSPFINTYAFIFLVGGAVASAIHYRKHTETYHRFIGNVFIAVGALLPGIGGSFTRMGYVEVLYVTEFIGLTLIYTGYRFNIRKSKPLSETVPAEDKAYAG
ncbi:MAG: hypothetical protein D6675_07160 [Gemmatimonadetes bacterium]|nr:MAG: hypothetical protein D6675_07160 [Gemmatimonadota bacterium]